MDLSQTKLTKVEWTNTEIPVSDGEKSILKLIIDGYHNVNIRTNPNQSMFQIMKIDYTPENEAFLYKKYYEPHILEMIAKNGKLSFKSPDLVSKQPKKVDVLRIEHIDKTLELRTEERSSGYKKRDVSGQSAGAGSTSIFEYVLIDICKKLSDTSPNQECIGGVGDAFWYYTLIQIRKSNITNTNRYVLQFVDYLISYMKPQIGIRSIIKQAYEFIEKNQYLLKYEDLTLFQHQKSLFSIMRNPSPKLVLYTAPTGTGKTLSPLGVSEQYRVIFICVARHVGLALAKSAISVGKRIAFAFGCETASDIRLHYFAATNYTVNKRSGAIAKVDNSIGDKVEIMICDVQSYLTAMHYMLAFNEESTIVTYWDEPTITMDYPEHELHQKIHENWRQNKISKMVLSCATLPTEHEIQETLMDFRCKFEGAEIHTIESYDCKKSIAILNKEGRAMLPHTIPEFSDYDRLMESVRFCESNKTLLRYFDLSEIVRFIEAVHGSPSPLAARYHIDSYFSDISEITMNSLKLYYLEIFKHLDATKWTQLHTELTDAQKSKFSPPLQPKENRSVAGAPIRKTKSVQVEWPSKALTTAVGIQKTQSTDVAAAAAVSAAASTATGGILLTTADAYTLTDGPTIFIAEDVEKIGKFYIQWSKIPPTVFDRMMEKIEKNNEVQKNLDLVQQKLEDKMGTNKPAAAEDNATKKDRKDSRREEMDPEIRRLCQQIEMLRGQIQSVNLDQVYIPNSQTHQALWAGTKVPNAFSPNIDDTVVRDIMELSVDNSMKILLLLGIGMFVNTPNPTYMEIMKRLAYEQKLYLIIASSDYIYGTNYAFCHGFIGKDLTNMTQQKIIQAMGRVGRNKIQQEYTVRFRDDSIMMRLFRQQEENLEAINMCRLFSE